MLTDKQKESVTDAIKALGRVEAAIEVGVTYQRYGELVGNAKAEVNDASQILLKGELLDQLSAVIDAYRDAGMVWSLEL